MSAVHERKAVFFSSPMRTSECLGVLSASRLVKWNIPMKLTFNNQSTCGGGAMLSQDKVKSDKLHPLGGEILQSPPGTPVFEGVRNLFF